MKTFKTLLLAGAMTVTVGAFAGSANAETIYTSVAPGTTVTTVTPGAKVTTEQYSVVGTRKVGMVGYRPYPLKASHVESTSVSTDRAPTQVVYSPNASVSSSTSVSTVTTSGEPIAYSMGGGNYYTENGTRYYRDPALNIDVRSTGSFND